MFRLSSLYVSTITYPIKTLNYFLLFRTQFSALMAICHQGRKQDFGNCPHPSPLLIPLNIEKEHMIHPHILLPSATRFTYLQDHCHHCHYKSDYENKWHQAASAASSSGWWRWSPGASASVSVVSAHSRASHARSSVWSTHSRASHSWSMIIHNTHLLHKTFLSSPLVKLIIEETLFKLHL